MKNKEEKQEAREEKKEKKKTEKGEEVAVRGGKKESLKENLGSLECKDKRCPFHGSLSTRGRKFSGYVKKILNKRIVVEFPRIIYFQKYERYATKKTRIHAHLPDCLAGKIKIGDYVKVAECRPISRIKHHVVVQIGRERK